MSQLDSLKRSFLSAWGAEASLSIRASLVRYFSSAWSATKEVAFTLVVSNFALLIAVFMYVVDTKGARLNVNTAISVIYSDIKPQEVLAYVLAIISAPLWIMVARWKARRHASLFFWMLGAQSLMVVGSMYIFAKARFGEIENPAFVEGWSNVCLVGSVLIWFATLLYQKLILDYSSDTKATPSGGDQSGSNIKLRVPE